MGTVAECAQPSLVSGPLRTLLDRLCEPKNNSNYILIVTSSKALVTSSFLLLLVRHLLLVAMHLFLVASYWTAFVNRRTMKTTNRRPRG